MSTYGASGADASLTPPERAMWLRYHQAVWELFLGREVNRQASLYLSDGMARGLLRDHGMADSVDGLAPLWLRA